MATTHASQADAQKLAEDIIEQHGIRYYAAKVMQATANAGSTLSGYGTARELLAKAQESELLRDYVESMGKAIAAFKSGDMSDSGMDRLHEGVLEQMPQYMMDAETAADFAACRVIMDQLWTLKQLGLTGDFPFIDVIWMQNDEQLFVDVATKYGKHFSVFEELLDMADGSETRNFVIETCVKFDVQPLQPADMAHGLDCSSLDEFVRRVRRDNMKRPDIDEFPWDDVTCEQVVDWAKRHAARIWTK